MNPAPVPLVKQLRCVVAEIAQRERSFKLQVGRGEMREAVAELELMHIGAVLASLQRLQRHEAAVRVAVRANPVPPEGVPPRPDALSLTSQIKCVEREIALRRNVYRGLVIKGRMPQAAADEGIAHMAAVLRTLEWLRRHEATIDAAIAADQQLQESA